MKAKSSSKRSAERKHCIRYEGSLTTGCSRMLAQWEVQKLDHLEGFLLTDTIADSELLQKKLAQSLKESTPPQMIDVAGPSTPQGTPPGTPRYASQDEFQSGLREHLITCEAADVSNTSWITDEDTHEIDLQGKDERLTVQAREEILKFGVSMKIPKWIRPRHHTVHIISDQFLKNWPQRDGRSVITREAYYNIQQLTRAIKIQQIQLQLPVVVIILRSVRQVECLEPLKNALSALCRAVRCSVSARIYISNTVPSPYVTPVLGVRANEHNKMLFEAVVGVNKRVGRVFYLLLAEHLWDGSKEFVQPLLQYFDAEGDLTYTGCVLAHSCIFREIGACPYFI